MFSLDVNHNASRIYQELVTKAPRRKSIHHNDFGSSMLLSSHPRQISASNSHQNVPNPTNLRLHNTVHDSTSRLLLDHPPYSKDTALQSRLQLPRCMDQTSRQTRNMTTKKHSLAAQIIHNNHQNALVQHASAKKSSEQRAIPKCFEPMTSYLVNDLAVKTKTSSSRTIYLRTKKGESLTMRLMRVSERYPETKERVSSKTLLYVIQGSALIQGHVTTTGESRRLAPLASLQMTALKGSDALILVIADALNTYTGIS